MYKAVIMIGPGGPLRFARSSYSRGACPSYAVEFGAGPEAFCIWNGKWREVSTIVSTLPEMHPPPLPVFFGGAFFGLYKYIDI